MRKRILLFAILAFAVLVSAPSAYAQGGAKNGPDPATLRDPELEKDSLHNLEVARQYFKLKKAYVGSLKRCEEVIAGNPTFAKMDEVLLIAGQSSLLLAENKGKQSPDQYVVTEGGDKRTLKREEFREIARGYLTQLVKDYPQSLFRKQAEDELQLIGPKLKEASKP
jgi:outer membrane protein assembly factor BamD (BamD/ComL family)